MTAPSEEPVQTSPTEGDASTLDPEVQVVPAGAAPEGAIFGAETAPLPAAVAADPSVATYAVQVQCGKDGPVLIASSGLARSAANNLRQAILDGGVHVVPES